MTNEEILKKAIDKARKSGWIIPRVYTITPEWILYQDGSNSKTDDDDILDYEPIIFSHDFAKAYWGETLITPVWEKVATFDEHHKYEGDKLVSIYGQNKTKAWEWHLQQMVLKPESLKYIEKFL